MLDQQAHVQWPASLQFLNLQDCDKIEDLAPFLGDIGDRELVVGDVIQFPAPAQAEAKQAEAPEELKGRRIKVKFRSTYVDEGNIQDYDESKKKHLVLYDDGDKEWYDFQHDELRRKFPDRFVFDGCESYLKIKNVNARGPCII
eukprot:g6037.t1